MHSHGNKADNRGWELSTVTMHKQCDHLLINRIGICYEIKAVKKKQMH